jgi:hypothetical protein
VAVTVVEADEVTVRATFVRVKVVVDQVIEGHKMVVETTGIVLHAVVEVTAARVVEKVVVVVEVTAIKGQ